MLLFEALSQGRTPPDVIAKSIPVVCSKRRKIRKRDLSNPDYIHPGEEIYLHVKDSDQLQHSKNHVLSLVRSLMIGGVEGLDA